jgi:hypothetical protein
MKKNSVLLSLSIATLGVVASAATASAVTFMPLTGYTDAQFEQEIADGLLKEPWAVESRIGNNSLSGDQELQIFEPRPFNVVEQGQRVWGNGEAVNFTLDFDGSLLTYAVGTNILQTTEFGGGDTITDLFFRLRSTENSSVSLTNLMLDGTALPNWDASGGEINYFKASDFGGAFSLTGTSTFSWTGERPRGSQLAYQIKAIVDEGPEVPEPATLSLLSLGALGLLGAQLRRKS